MLLFCFLVLLFIYWRLDLIEGKNGIKLFWFLALYLELC